jgi:hypothetical protein
MTKTQLAILWGLGVLAVVVLSALGFLMSQARQPHALSPTATPAERPPQAQSPPQAEYRLPETPYSARNVYGRAEQAARDWQPDAALVSAAASWPFASLDNFSRPADWTFQFYSPATGRVYVINVNQEGIAPIRETLSPYSLAPIEVDRWQVDSYQAVNAWLNRGGGAFLKRHAVVDVSIRLSRPQGGAAEWTVFGVQESGQSTHTERVDAYEGSNL